MEPVLEVVASVVLLHNPGKNDKPVCFSPNPVPENWHPDRFSVLPGRKKAFTKASGSTFSTWEGRKPRCVDPWVLALDIPDVTAHPADWSSPLHLTSPHAGGCGCGRWCTFTTLQILHNCDCHLWLKSVPERNWTGYLEGNADIARGWFLPSGINRNHHSWKGDVFGFLSNHVKSMQEKRASAGRQPKKPHSQFTSLLCDCCLPAN